jgi:hypothetical protein
VKIHEIKQLYEQDREKRDVLENEWRQLNLVLEAGRQELLRLQDILEQLRNDYSSVLENVPAGIAVEIDEQIARFRMLLDDERNPTALKHQILVVLRKLSPDYARNILGDGLL